MAAFLICLLPILALASCSLSKEEPAPTGPAPKKEPVTLPRLIGRIASVPADHRFVLIQSYAKWDIAPDSILTSRGNDGRTANLLATGEHLGQYAAADLQSGQVAVGDAVFDRPEIQSKADDLTPSITNLPPALQRAVEIQETEKAKKDEPDEKTEKAQ
ncbi:hypothetical protein [Luteolibacter pohnpeiensis]|nr:hypothetical protein [Luteolibacter pohnpeiensis]